MIQNPPQSLRPCFISTYPPRACGIATFTADLRQALVASIGDGEVVSSVVAITNGPRVYGHPSEVVFEISQAESADYRLAAEYINRSSANVVSLQHEFGIFGGECGQYILDLLGRLHKPVVTTLHTVVRAPEPGYRDSLIRVAAASDRLVVMNSRAIPILRDVYGVPESKVRFIHHGVPEIAFLDPNYYKDKFGVEGRLVLLTFGLLSRNKGIEMVLDALPDVVSRHPEVVYIVLGATHPEVKRREGEEYRLWLQERVQALGLQNHVIFHDRYVELNTLLEFIGSCDIYITPYRSKEQIVSGTLAYAVGMGKAVISTPYWYAKELLADGRGRLVRFDDPTGLGQTINALIENRAARHRMRKRAYKYGQQMVWREVGNAYRDTFNEAMDDYCTKLRPKPARALATNAHEFPRLRLDSLLDLTDDTGIIQHGAYGIPDRRFGYSTDDVARALVATLMYYRLTGDGAAPPLAIRYMSFLQYAQRSDGRFHNFMNYAHQFVDECGSEDTLGRTLWGLGTAVAYGSTEGMRALALEIFERTKGVLEFKHPRAMAYAICGLYGFLQYYDGATWVRGKLIDLANQLAALFKGSVSADWRWFGDEITYANAKMPQAMLLAHQATGMAEYKAIGLESLDFLIQLTYQDGRFDFVGNRGWFRRGGERAIFSQQPIEAGYTAEACMTAFAVTGNEHYRLLARSAAEWLLGRNRLGACLYDLKTGACSDGLDPQGPSMNQGAESAICGLWALLAVAPQQMEARDSSSPLQWVASGQTTVNRPLLMLPGSVGYTENLKPGE